MLDGGCREAGFEELRVIDDAVLPRGRPRDLRVLGQ
jgi:hypothetical protein